MRKRVEISWVEAGRIALSLERNIPIAQGNKYTIHNHMCFKSYASLSQDTTPVRSIECSEGSPNLMNTIVLKII